MLLSLTVLLTASIEPLDREIWIIWGAGQENYLSSNCEVPKIKDLDSGPGTSLPSLTTGTIYIYPVVTVVAGNAYCNCSIAGLSFCNLWQWLPPLTPPPSWQCRASMIYDSDCQGLLKAIQFEDLGSRFLSLLAHLMDSCYQLACFIIVRTLIEVVFLQKKLSKSYLKKILLHHISSPLCPKLLCVRFTVPSFTSLWLADLAKRSLHSSFIVLCLVFCLFEPFLHHRIKAFVSSITEAWYSDSLQ